MFKRRTPRVGRLSERTSLWAPLSRLKRFGGPLLACMLVLSCHDADQLTGPFEPSFALNGASGFEGTVTRSDGIAIAGAVIRVLDRNTGATLASGTSAANGAYSVVVADGTYDVRVEAPGFQSQILSDLTVSGPTTLNVVLLKFITFSGVVRNDEGAPIDRQLVNLYNYDLQTSISDTTTADGAFSLRLSEGRYFLQVIDQRPAGVPSGQVRVSSFNIAADLTQDITIPISRVDVTVVDPVGTPVNNSSVSSDPGCFVNVPIGEIMPGVQATAIFCPNAYTGPDNLATLHFYNTSTPFSLVATPPQGSQLGAGRTSFPSGISADAAVTIALLPAARFSGLVRRADGTPLPNQRVRLIDGNTLIEATTGADGRFAMYAAVRTYALLRLEDYYSGPFDYSLDIRPFELVGNTDVVMTLPTHTLTLTVLDPDGHPVQGASGSSSSGLSTTLFELFPGHPVTYGYVRPSGTTDATGVTRLLTLPTRYAGEGRVYPPPNSGLIANTFTFPIMDADKALSVTLLRAVRFTGRLTDRDGNGIRNAIIQFRGASKGFYDTTDDLGAFAMDFEPGIATYGESWASSVPSNRMPRWFQLQLGGPFSITESTDMTLVLPNIILSVTVLDLSGAPVSGAKITGQPKPGGFRVLPGLDLVDNAFTNQTIEGTTNASGVAQLGMLPTLRNFAITVTPPAGSGLETAVIEVPAINHDGNLAVIAPPSNDAPFAVITPLDPEVDEGTTIDFDGSASSDPEGEGLHYLWTLPDGATATTPQVGVSFPRAGTFEVTLRVTDSNGAFDEATSTVTVNPVVQTDPTPPVVSYALSGAQGAADWYVGPVTVTWTVTDPESPIISSDCVTSTISTDGAGHRFTCVARSEGGETQGSTRTFNIDQTPPTVRGEVSGTLGNGGWYTSAVSVAWVVVEQGSGLAQDCPVVNDITVDGDNFAFRCTATDRAGNRSAEAAISLKRDATPPSVSYRFDGTLGNGGWYTSAVNVTWSVAADLSGLVRTCDMSTLATDGRDLTALCEAEDGAGNTTSVRTQTFNIDQTPPTIAFFNNAGLYDVAAMVDITCTATDATSGPESQVCAGLRGYAWDLIIAETVGLGANKRSATAQDVAGNKGSGETSLTIGVSYQGLCTLVELWVSDKGVANSLCVKLQAAERAAARGDTRARDGSLGAFINEVRAQADKKIEQGKAPYLVRFAEALMS